MTERPVTREAIEKTATGLRTFLASQGQQLTQEQAVARCAQAQRKEDHIRSQEGR